VAVKIKLKRLGKIRAPYYRIVVADSRTKRDGRAIEEIGKYHPKAEPSFIEVDSERAQHWLSVGAQPTDPVRKIFEITGDWQKFKGLPGTEGTLKTAAPKEDRKEIFAAAVKETLGDAAPTPKGRSRSAKDSAAAGDKGGKSASKAEQPKAEQPKAEKPAKAKADQPAKAKADDEAKAAADGKAAGDAKAAADGKAAGDAKAAADGKVAGDAKAAADGKAKDKAKSAKDEAAEAAGEAQEAEADPAAVAADSDSADGN
jgi:small subunit ribosomal protein S16